MFRRMAVILLAYLCLIAQIPAQAQETERRAERINADVYWKIRREATDNSQIMRTIHYLTDLYGPRLTGSPRHKAAAEWAAKQLEQWGLKNARLEAWDFGRPGWENERAYGHIVSPVKDALTFEVLAWTPSTNGTVKAQAFHLVAPEKPTKEQMEAFLNGARENARGRIVLVGEHTQIPVSFNPSTKRRDEQEARNTYDPNVNAPQQTPPVTPSPDPTATPAVRQPPQPLTSTQAAQMIDQFLSNSGALMRINDAGREHGQIRAFQHRAYDPTKTIPTVILRNEDYGRITRILADKTPVELEFNIENSVYPEGKTSYNVIAEIPGSGDKKDEVVMLGGHLDSWHAATGATDNAAGCAIMMEAARILKAVNAKPKRTIRVALWSGEEQGLLGSKAYVAKHFGSFESPKPDYMKFNGYVNVDSGTGRLRGASVFGPLEAATVLREALAPFDDIGFEGVIATFNRRTGGSDHTSFNEAGLPGIGMGQDPIEYGSHTWHTNLDTYERIVEDDVKAAAIIVAAAVYHLATREETLPRFTKETMPPSPNPSPAPTPTPQPARP